MADKETESEDTFSDIIPNDNTDHDVDKNQEEDHDDSDEFDFSERPKRLKLKPSKAQQKAEQKPKPTDTNPQDDANDDSEDDGIAIQSNILSDYLKPTNILSKYQNGPPTDPQQPSPEQEEEEEKEWPTSKEELAFNNATDAFHQNNNNPEQDEEEEEEEKSDFDPIEFEDLYECLMEQANDEIDTKDIIIEDFRNVGWYPYLKMFILGGCALALRSNELNEERDGIFKIAKLKLDLTNVIHHRCLITLWMKLTDDTRQCDKTGSHWQQIGFQGNDPSTDVRGAGLLGILQLIYINENYKDIISKIYLLSLNDHQNFPLVIVSFTITGIVIQLLRSCLIYNNINKHKSVMYSINEIYVALFYQFYLNWKNKSRTVINFDEAQKELEQEAFSNWQQLLDQLTKREDEIKQYQNSQKQKVNSSDDEEVEFGNVSSNNPKKSDKSKTKRQNPYKV